MANELRPDTVEALLETVRDFLRAEDDRGDGLITRGSGVATFAGLIVSVLGVLGKQILDQPVDSAAKEAAALAFIAAFTFLILTLAIALWGLLWPRSYNTISMEEIERYPYPEFVFAERVMIQGRTVSRAGIRRGRGSYTDCGRSERHMGQLISATFERNAKPGSSPFPRPIIQPEEKSDGSGGEKR